MQIERRAYMRERCRVPFSWRAAPTHLPEPELWALFNLGQHHQLERVRSSLQGISDIAAQIQDSEIKLCLAALIANQEHLCQAQISVPTPPLEELEMSVRALKWRCATPPREGAKLALCVFPGAASNPGLPLIIRATVSCVREDAPAPTIVATIDEPTPELERRLQTTLLALQRQRIH